MVFLRNRGASRTFDEIDGGEGVAADERAARDLIRAQYAAPDAVPIAIDRIATRGKTQVAELLAHLRKSGLDAHDVFGVYRVPDRISGPVTPQSEKNRVVEWDVVRAAGTSGAPRAEDGDADRAGGARTNGARRQPGAVRPQRQDPPATAPRAILFDAGEQWVARSVGARSILDEDLALAYLLEVGIGPERCLGIARIAEFRRLRTRDEDEPITARVTGVVAIHPEQPGGAGATLRKAAPLVLAPDHAAAAGVHVEVLDWAAIGRVVNPKIHHPPAVPSSQPHLPSTPQELLLAYLKVVGVRPADSYGAQATIDRPRKLVDDRSVKTNVGPKQPCADGKRRMRTRGCEQVVLVYRDRPEYAEGRARWEAYEAEVLRARLRRDPRPPIEGPVDLSGMPAGARTLVRAATLFNRAQALGAEKTAPYRYCWPPTDLGRRGRG